MWLVTEYDEIVDFMPEVRLEEFMFKHELPRGFWIQEEWTYICAVKFRLNKLISEEKECTKESLKNYMVECCQ